MRYLTRFCETTSPRLRSIVEMQWNTIGRWIHLIASASYPFPEAMRALAEPMCVFPIEGLPGERYFPGTAVMDAVELRAEELLLRIFSVQAGYRATIQPHSGTQANQIVYNTVLGPEDTVLSLSPAEGGHISHKVIIGRRNRVVNYYLDSASRIDYAALQEVALQIRPRLIIAGGSACPREIDFAAIGTIARDVGAFFHADISHTATFVAAGVHASVFPHADFVTFNMIKNMRGPNGGVLMYRDNLHRQVATAVFPVTQGGPNENTLFAKLVALESIAAMDLPAYARRMVHHSRHMGRVFQDRGLRVVTGGTDSHLLLVDLRGHPLDGVQAEHRCEAHRVLVNRNLVPGDERKPAITSGIRLGTACITILDYTDDDVARLAEWIADRLDEQEPACGAVELVDELTERYNAQLLPLHSC